MPYYIYKITEPLLLEYLDETARFLEAKELVKKLRRELTPSSAVKVRMVFADSIGEAERLLTIPRDTRVIGED